ncbi:transglutaminase TgpA family protein [Amycolatopsis thermophila]|uniref:Transglutaminase-like putative cysteine protease n=1 Tax=Amycolatopsis thermophila TaxID=206084 RepID=A0ABU0F440_9PSEU|nr:transglutaminaseTgpA domain-containing protein [Amycolatopsis thermophila]MDQ0382349.1 transglutaminase-like putative cysteine protease [Amycolatopsis thermophila]
MTTLTGRPPRPGQQPDAPPPGRPELHRPTQRVVEPPPQWRVSILAPVAAAVATLCASTSLTGVVGGLSWFGYVTVAVVLVAATGLALRAVRTPTAVVGLAQLVVLLLLITGVFTSRGILGVIPGPAAFDELNGVLTAAFEQIRTGLPPVEATPPILCLVTIAIGLVAVLVDTLAVAASAPAATGLVLLCVYAVPASLADSMLPWWTFLLGAAAFAGLLAVDGNHRHRRWRNRDAPGLGNAPAAASAPVAVVAVALVLGLVAGTTLTAVGTVGRLPGSGGNGSGTGSGGLGVNPFTSLRGMLDQGSTVDLFRVRGLGNDKRLLRAFTLDTYRPNHGWSLPDGPMPAGFPAGQPLPAAPGDNGTGEARQITIEPLNWVDVWMPVYGQLRGLQGVPQGWYYDPTSGAVFSERKQRIPAYVETASLAEPSKEQLESAKAGGDIPASYSQITGVDPRVASLARSLAAGATTDFDRATAIWRYFGAENGFTYDTQTAAATDSDALADFLLKGKRGFCEQFASAMAVMLRVLNIPSRVAVGFTSGYADGDSRMITSQDAHAWVEVYFADLGWVSFDPTPRSDGRGYVPPYLQSGTTSGGSSDSEEQDVPSVSTTRVAPTGAPAPQDSTANTGGAQAAPAGSAPSWTGWTALALVLVALALTGAAFVAIRKLRGRPASWLPLAAVGAWLVTVVLTAWLVHWILALVLLLLAVVGLAPAVVREIHRRRRLAAITARRPGAADAAWAELMDECADRGIPIPPSDTVRAAAQKVAAQHNLDEAGQTDLRTVVGVVERSWYSPDSSPGEDLSSAFEGLRRSLERTAPMSWRGRLFPRSVFRKH